MIERARTFGEHAELACVIAEASPESRRKGLPCVLMWNAGLLHCVGPYRMWVDLSRQLAEAGFVSMRFDLSGVGDSEADKSGRFTEDRSVAEVRQAMDYMESSRGATSFVLVGLCSSAIDAHHVAVSDARVCGAAMLDGYGYRTRGYYLRHYGPRMFHLGSWTRLIRRKAASLLPSGEKISDAGADGPEIQPVGRIGQLSFRPFPPRAEATAEVHTLVERGVKLLYVYSGGVVHYYNHQRQFREMFGSGALEHARVVHLRDADHLYTGLEARREVMRTIRDWIETTFKAPSGKDTAERPTARP